MRRLRAGISEYHSEGVAPFPAEVFFAVQTDLEYRAKWDSSCAGLSVIETLSPAAKLM